MYIRSALWVFDSAGGGYYPVDTWNSDKAYHTTETGESREGLCSISLVPNLGQTGKVLIFAATGGSAANAGADFLADEASLSAVFARLKGTSGQPFPYFELLLRVKGRGSPPKEAIIEVCRTPRLH